MCKIMKHSTFRTRVEENRVQKSGPFQIFSDCRDGRYGLAFGRFVARWTGHL